MDKGGVRSVILSAAVQQGDNVAELKIRIPEDEMAWLDVLAKTQGTTKTRIVRSALRKVFEENFLNKKTIHLPGVSSFS